MRVSFLWSIKCVAEVVRGSFFALRDRSTVDSPNTLFWETILSAGFFCFSARNVLTARSFKLYTLYDHVPFLKAFTKTKWVNLTSQLIMLFWSCVPTKFSASAFVHMSSWRSDCFLVALVQFLWLHQQILGQVLIGGNSLESQIKLNSSLCTFLCSLSEARWKIKT